MMQGREESLIKICIHLSVQSSGSTEERKTLGGKISLIFSIFNKNLCLLFLLLSIPISFH
jgi:hypothetical protein